jgi:hypothetical protein
MLHTQVFGDFSQFDAAGRKDTVQQTLAAELAHRVAPALGRLRSACLFLFRQWRTICRASASPLATWRISGAACANQTAKGDIALCLGETKGGHNILFTRKSAMSPFSSQRDDDRCESGERIARFHGSASSRERRIRRGARLVFMIECVPNTWSGRALTNRSGLLDGLDPSHDLTH